MRRLMAVGILGTLGLLVWACDGATPTGTNYKNPTPPAVATVTPTPRPTPTPVPWVGLWKIANTGNLGALDGYTVEIASYDAATGAVRGRSVYKYSGFTGALRGTVRGNHIDWQSDLTGQGDTENGSMDMKEYSNGLFLEGFLKFEIRAIGTGQYNGIALRRE
jgi:hypothetical protein